MVAPTTAPYTLLDPPRMEAARIDTDKLNPNDSGARKWSRFANRHPAIPAGNAPIAYAASFIRKTEIPVDEASTGLCRSTRNAVPWRDVTRLRSTSSHSAV